MPDQCVSRFLVNTAGPSTLDLKRGASTDIRQAACRVEFLSFSHDDGVFTELAGDLLPFHSGWNAQLPATARTSLGDSVWCCGRTHGVAFLNFETQGIGHADVRPPNASYILRAS